MDGSCIFATNCGKNISSESLNIYVNAFLFLHQSTQYIHIIFTLWLKEKKLRTRGEKEMYTRKSANRKIGWLVSVLFPFFWSLLCTMTLCLIWTASEAEPTSTQWYTPRTTSHSLQAQGPNDSVNTIADLPMRSIFDSFGADCPISNCIKSSILYFFPWTN